MGLYAMPGAEADDVLQLPIAQWPTPDVEGAIDDVESSVHGHAGLRGGLEETRIHAAGQAR